MIKDTTNLTPYEHKQKIQNIEFIRLIAILAIIMLHFFRGGGFSNIIYMQQRIYFSVF